MLLYAAMTTSSQASLEAPGATRPSTRTSDVLAVVPLTPIDPSANLLIAGRPVVEWTLRALSQTRRIAAVALAAEQPVSGPVDRALRSLARSGIRISVYRGSRWQVVQQALVAEPAVRRVVLHDSNRPLVSPEALEEFLASSEGMTGAVGSVPVKNTYKRVVDGVITASPPRDRLRLVQGPWVFGRDVLEPALAGLPSAVLDRCDELAFVREAALTVRMLPGHAFNVSITSPEDVRFAELAVSRSLVRTAHP